MNFKEKHELINILDKVLQSSNNDITDKERIDLLNFRNQLVNTNEKQKLFQLLLRIAKWLVVSYINIED